MTDLSDNVKLHVKVERLCVAIEGSNKNMERIYKTVYGDGNGESGLVIKTDRNTQTIKNTKKLAYGIGGGTLGLIIEYIRQKIGL